MDTNDNHGAEQLNRQLDAMLSSDEQLDAALQDDNPLVRAAARLAQGPHPALSQSAKVLMLDQVLSRRILRPNFWAWAARIAALFVFAVLGLIFVAQQTLPGDILYPVKRQVEQVELAFARDDTGRANIHLKLADTRIAEGESLLDRNQFDDAIMDDALDNFEAAVTIAERNALFDEALFYEHAQSTHTAYNHALERANEQGFMTQERHDSLLVRSSTLNNRLAAEQNTDSTLGESGDSGTELLTATEELTEAVEVTEPALVTEETTEAVEVTEPPALVSEDEPAAFTPETSESGQPQQTTGISNTSDILYVIPGGRINVRSGPGTSFDIVDTATPNTEVQAIGYSAARDWTQVILPNGTQGWIASRLLSDTAGTGSSNDTEEDCERPGNACNAPGHGGENPGNPNGNGRGRNND